MSVPFTRAQDLADCPLLRCAPRRVGNPTRHAGSLIADTAVPFTVCLTRCLGQGAQPLHEVCRHCTPIVATVCSSWTLWCKARPGKTLPGGALPQDSTSLHLPTSVLCVPVQPVARPRAACPRTGARRRTSVRGCARPRASR